MKNSKKKKNEEKLFKSNMSEPPYQLHSSETILTKDS